MEQYSPIVIEALCDALEVSDALSAKVAEQRPDDIRLGGHY